MDLDALSDSPVGQLVPIRGSDARHGAFAYFAFLPLRLPSDVVLETKTWGAVADATAALARLDQACGQLPDPGLLIRPALWREALDTSALEGTYGQLPDLLEAQLPRAQFVSSEIVEIRAYERVALRAFEAITERPITVGFLSESQGDLFMDAKTKPRDVGKVREHQVWVGSKDAPIEEARFVPPPGDDRLKAGLEDWQEWIATAWDLPPVLRAAMAHYQFETLHPFGDGNGRIGRLLIVLQLLRTNAIRFPAVTVSPWLLKRREDYQTELLRMSCTGDWNPWVRFFCQAVCEQCSSLIVGADKLTGWLNESRAALNQRRWTGTIHTMLEDLTEWPVMSISFAASRYDVTTMTATRMVDHLVEIGILEELTGRSYGRLFGATGVMSIIDAI